jgi:hypothetical protein
VTSPAQAVLEVAAVAPGELVDVIDEGLARRVLDRRELERVLARNRPCRGAARLAALLGDETAMAITRSKAEKAFLRLMRDAGLPRPEVNEQFGSHVPDFMWRRERWRGGQPPISDPGRAGACRRRCRAGSLAARPGASGRMARPPASPRPF